jgi:large subunit ribosomal protein L22
MAAQARAFQRSTRQSPYKMRLVIDQIRGKDVNEALTLLAFSKKHAAREITKVLKSAVANVEYKARQADDSVDVDQLYVKHAIINEGRKLKRWMPAAQGRATPIHKRTSHIEIIVAVKDGR